MTERSIPAQTCWSCRHFEFSYEPNWSAHTPGDGFYFKCRKDHFDHSQTSMTESEFAMAMEFGFTCPDFERKDK